MRVDVYALPAAALAVQSFRKRGEAAYLDAHEELRAAVVTKIAEAGCAPAAPYARVSLTVICYVGKKRQDGLYRAERVHTLHYTLDPIYRALLDAGVIASMEAIYEIRTCLVRDSAHEGFRIDARPLSEQSAEHE